MPRLNQAGKDIRRVLEWLLNRDVPDSEIGSILGLSKATYSRRKDAEDFPSFAELTSLGDALGVSPRVLQIAFGWRGTDELVLLTVEEGRQYLDQVGAAVFGTEELIEEVRRYIKDRTDSPIGKAVGRAFKDLLAGSEPISDPAASSA
jgi:hypothetical protein